MRAKRAHGEPSPRCRTHKFCYRSIFTFLSAGTLVILGWTYLSPYLALDHLKQALEAGDRDSLNESVDFPALRSSLREQLNAQMVASFLLDNKDANAFSVLGAALARGMVNALIDQYVTPEVAAAIIQHKRVDGPPLLTEAVNRYSQANAKDNLVKISWNYQSINRFDVRLSLKDDKAEAITLIFLRSGLANWRLSDIRLPLKQESMDKAKFSAWEHQKEQVEQERKARQAREVREIEKQYDDERKIRDARQAETDAEHKASQARADAEAKVLEERLGLHRNASEAQADVCLIGPTCVHSEAQKTFDREPGRVFRVGGGVTAPSLLFKVEPEYTEEARKAKYQGTVLLYVQVDPSGRAINMRVLHSLGGGLDEKAMESVGKWKFRPGTKDGYPVTVEAQIEVNFRLL
jgi:TonB family protein